MWVGEYSGTFFNDKGESSPSHQAGGKCPAFTDLTGHVHVNWQDGTSSGYVTWNR